MCLKRNSILVINIAFSKSCRVLYSCEFKKQRGDVSLMVGRTNHRCTNLCVFQNIFVFILRQLLFCKGADLRKNSVGQIYVVPKKIKGTGVIHCVSDGIFFSEIVLCSEQHSYSATCYISCAYLDFTDSLPILVFQNNIFEICEH